MNKNKLNHFLFILLICGISLSVNAQQNQINVLDQNISIVAEDRPVTEVLKYICDEFNLDFDYNSKLIKGKRISLNISNKTVGEILDNLMDEFYLIFEIEDNVLMIRDYVPSSEHIEFKELYNTETSGFLFDDPQNKTATIKFKLISNLIVIPLSINGSDTMNFILDTGVKSPIITELTMVDELELNYMKPINLKGLGSDGSTQAYQSGDNSIKIDGLTARKQLINVVIDDNFQISKILGIPVHGLIGFNMFRQYVVRVNYKSRQIKLYKPQFWKYRPRRKDIVLPIHFTKNKPMVRAEVMQRDSEEPIDVLLMVDTGASDALWLGLNSSKKIKLPEKKVHSYLGAGINGDLYGYKGRIDGIWIGGKILDEPIVAYPDSGSIQHLMMVENRNGTIGGELLRRFTLYFDYFNSRLVMRPNSSFKDDFNYNMSGLEIIAPVPGVPVFTISSLDEGSPAAKAGLQVNDQILKLNRWFHTSLSLNDINLVLRQNKGKKVKITVLRGGQEIKTSFVLKEAF